MTSHLVVRARLHRFGEQSEVEFVGGAARLLLELVRAGERGCPNWDELGCRVLAHVGELRSRYGLTIRSPENTDCEWYGRHFLETPVEILAIEHTEDFAA